MKKLLILILSLAIILSLSACTKNDNNQVESISDDSSNEVSITETVEYEFYVDYNYSGEIPEKTKEFKSYNELHVGLGYKRVTLNNTDKTKKIEFDGKEIELEYRNTVVSDPDNLKFNSYNRGYDRYLYTNNDDYIIIMVRNDTGDICLLSTGINNDSLSAPLLSNDEYKEIAINELNARLPSGWNKVYTVCEIENNESGRFVCATFTRTDLFGFRTWEFIHVYMDYDGRVNCFDTRMYGLFDEVVNTVTKEEIDSAYTAMKSHLVPEGSKNNLSSSMLYIDNKGTLYLSASYTEITSKQDGGNCTARASVFVNVN